MEPQRSEPQTPGRTVREGKSEGLNTNTGSTSLRQEAELFRLTALNTVQEAFALLARSLPPGLHYHNLEHTVDVVTTAVSLAQEDGLAPDEIELIAVAAAWHDTGFVVQRQANEPAGAAFAARSMKNHGYSDEDIETVKGMILDTQMQFDAAKGTVVQHSRSRLAGYLLDGDLGNLGRSDFIEKSVQLIREFTGKELEELTHAELRNFFANSVRLMEHHQYHTPAGKKILEAPHVNNCKLAKILSELQDSESIQLLLAELQ